MPAVIVSILAPAPEKSVDALIVAAVMVVAKTFVLVIVAILAPAPEKSVDANTFVEVTLVTFAVEPENVVAKTARLTVGTRF